MAFIIKDRARGTLVSGRPSEPEVYPNGIGGIDGRGVCFGFRLGSFRCVMTRDQWIELSDEFRRKDLADHAAMRKQT